MTQRVIFVEPLGVIGGMGHYTDALVSAYAAEGMPVRVVTTSASSELHRVAEVRISRAYRLAVRRGFPAVVRAAAYVLGHLRTLVACRPGDILVVHFMHAPSIDLWWLRALRGRRVTVVLLAHDPVPVTRGGLHRRYRECLSQAHVLVVHGPTARNDLLNLGVPEARVVVAPFGRFRAVRPMSRPVACRLLAISELPRPVVAIIGHMKPGKGIGRVLTSLAHAPGAIGTLLLAGASQGDPGLETAVAAARNRGTPIQRVDRRLTDAQELAAYSLADVVLAVYETGYSSGVVARAHAVGRRVVLTNVGDLPLQARVGDVVLEPSYSPSALISAILQEPEPAAHSDGARQQEPDPGWRDHVRAVVAAISRLPHSMDAR